MGRIGEIDHPHLADRARHEGAAAARWTATAPPTTSAPAATSPNTPSARPSPTGSTPRSARSSRASSPTSSCGSPAFFGVKPHAGPQGRRRSPGPRWATPTPPSPRRSRCCPARCSAPPPATAAATSVHFVAPQALDAASPTGSPSAAAWYPWRTPGGAARRDMPVNDALPRIEVDPGHVRRSASTASRDRATPPARRCRWPSATSCSDDRASDEPPAAPAPRRLAGSPPAGTPTRAAPRRRSPRARPRPGDPGGLPAGPPAHRRAGRGRPRRGRRACAAGQPTRSADGWTRRPTPARRPRAQRAASRAGRAGCCARGRAACGPSPPCSTTWRGPYRGPHQPIALGAAAHAAGRPPADAALAAAYHASAARPRRRSACWASTRSPSTGCSPAWPPTRRHAARPRPPSRRAARLGTT